MNQYYTYAHSIEGVIFYVGVGKSRKKTDYALTFKRIHERAFAIAKRSVHWKSYRNGRDFSVTILEYYKTMKEAFDAEISLIAKHGRLDLKTGTLVNRTIGGINGTNSPLARLIPIMQFDLTGNLVKRWDSVRSIQEETGFLKTNIVKCCRKKYITAYGFVWKYEKEGALADIKPRCPRNKKDRPELEPFRGTKLWYPDKENLRGKIKQISALKDPPPAA